MRVTLKTDSPQFFRRNKSPTEIAEDMKALMEIDSDEGLWGKPTDKRSVALDCYKPPVIHYMVNGQNRLVYLKRL